MACFVLDTEIDKLHGVFYTEGEGKLYSFYLKIAFCFFLPLSPAEMQPFLFLHATASI